MLALLLTLTVLGLLDSLNPSTIITAILLLSTASPLLRTWAFIAGTLVTYLPLGLLLYFGLGFLGPESPFFAWFRLGLGVVFVGVAIYFSFKPMPSFSQTLGKLNPLAVFGFGIAATLSDFPTAFPYLAATEQLVSAKLSEGVSILLLIAYNVLYILPLILLIGVYMIAKHRLNGLPQHIESFFTRHGRALVVAFMYPLGFWFVYQGFQMLSR
jgi:cytochrome c biogenesis protein CcdA